MSGYHEIHWQSSTVLSTVGRLKGTAVLSRHWSFCVMVITSLFHQGFNTDTAGMFYFYK